MLEGSLGLITIIMGGCALYFDKSSANPKYPTHTHIQVGKTCTRGEVEKHRMPNNT